MTSHHYNVVIISLDSRTTVIRHNNEISALQDAVFKNGEASIIKCDNNDEDFLCCIDPHIHATLVLTRFPGALVSDLDDAGWRVYENSELVQVRPDTSTLLAMNVAELRVILARQTNILYVAERRESSRHSSRESSRHSSRARRVSQDKIHLVMLF
jgi:hypothetical protein